MKPTVLNDPRTRRLTALLAGNYSQACGLLELVWHFAADRAPEGEIGKALYNELAGFTFWPGPEDEIASKLATSGWAALTEAGFMLADWLEHMPPRLANSIRQRKVRDVARQDPPRSTLSRDNDHRGPPSGATEGTKVPVNGTEVPHVARQDPPSSNPVKGGRGDVFGPGECAEDTSPEQKAKPSVALGSAFEELRVLWNKTPGTIPCRQSNPDRLKKLSTRLKEDAYRDCWREALAKFPLPMFDRPPRGDGKKHWTPTIDWFLTPSKVVQIVEGKYDAVIDRDNKQQPLSANLYDLLPQELETHE